MEPAAAAAAAAPPPPVKTSSPSRRQVGFLPSHDTSPSSVLRHGPADSPQAGAQAAAAGRQGATPDLGPQESPSALAAALRREKSLPSLPKLRLGLKGGGSKGLGQRSKSFGNLQTAAVEAPPAPKSATNSPQAASSSGSEPLSRPFNIPRQRRTVSIDFEQGPHPGDDADMVSTPVISAASSLLDRHLGAAAASGGGGQGSGSPAASPVQGSAILLRSAPSTKELYVAQADAVTAHAQVLNLQSALKKEQEEVVRLRGQLELMTAERDRLIMELQHGCDSVFTLDRSSMDVNTRRPGYQPPPMPPAGGTAAAHLAAGQPPRPRSALRTMFRLP